MESQLTLNNLLKTTSATESTDDRTFEVENPHQANKLHHSKKTNRHNYKPSQGDNTLMRHVPTRPKFNLKPKQCRLCGGIYPHQSICPAASKNCRLCVKQNQFAKNTTSQDHTDTVPECSTKST